MNTQSTLVLTTRIAALVCVIAVHIGCHQLAGTNKLGAVVLPITVKDATVRKVRAGTTWVMHAQVSDADARALIKGLNLHWTDFSPSRGDVSDLLPYFPPSIGTNEISEMYGGPNDVGFLKLFLTKSGTMILILERP